MHTRPLVVEDAAAVTALVRRYEEHWNVPLVTPEDEIHEELTAPTLDISSDTRGVWIDDELIAYGIIWHRPSGVRLERAYLFGAVDPRFTRRGIGTDLISWEIERAKELLEQTAEHLPKFLRVDDWDWIEPTHDLYRQMGFVPVRYFKDMVRKLDDRMGVEPTTGVDVVPFDRTRDEAILSAWNESFADHWGTTPVDPDTYRHRMDGSGTRLDLSHIAVSGEDVVGLTINAQYPEDETVTGRREGWIEVLGVRRDWRGRGVATALIEASCNSFRDAGMTHAALNVDSENVTGAFGLYTRLGFEATYGTITYEIETRQAP